jgi:hypothetical protein
MANAAQLIPIHAYWALRGSIALVWLYQGLWHKLLAVDEHHRRIVEQALGATLGPVALSGIGLVETAIAGAVLAAFKPMQVAWLQIVLLAGMNTAGLLSAAGEIPDPVGMVTMNLVFGVATWVNGRLSCRA